MYSQTILRLVWGKEIRIWILSTWVGLYLLVLCMVHDAFSSVLPHRAANIAVEPD